MGREITYRLISPTALSAKDLSEIASIQQSFNSRFPWQRDGICFDTEAVHQKCHSPLEGRRRVLREEGFNEFQTNEILRREGLLVEAKTVCEVTGESQPGSDTCGVVILAGLLLVSRKFPSAKIEVKDDGELLPCPVVIQAGAARPDYMALRHSLSEDFAAITARSWQPILGVLANDDYLRPILPTYGSEFQLTRMKRQMAALHGFLRDYRDLFNQHRGPKPFTFSNAHDFFVGLGVFLDSQRVSSAFLLDCLRRGGRNIDSNVNATDRTERLEAWDAIFSGFAAIASAERTA